MSDTTNEPEYLDCQQLAGKLNVALKTVRKWAYLRRIPGRVALGPRCVRFNRQAVERALNSGAFLLATKGN